MSSATVGREREHFVSAFLGAVLPSSFRVGTGDITDSYQARTGQVDAVIEFPFLPSIPLANDGPRLYLAEGVASVLEVKSSVEKQWDEVISTATRVKTLKRRIENYYSIGATPTERIPVLAVGYSGWNTIETVREKAASGPVDLILVIDSALCATRDAQWARGPSSMVLFLEFVHQSISSLKAAGTSLVPYVQ